MQQTEILCIGSVLWDVIGRHPNPMPLGADRPGRITRLPGGVALNIAMTLRRFDLSPVLLSAIGTDEEGGELFSLCQGMGLNCDYIYRDPDLPTDVYMAIEGANGLIAAIADAHSLEAAGDEILTPLADGRLGDLENPYGGVIVLDGNLTESLLDQIAHSPLFRAADLRLAPASPGKAERLAPLLNQRNVTLYVNLEEAGLLCDRCFADSKQAAARLLQRGLHRVLVTDGANMATLGSQNGLVSQMPPQVAAKRITGAGDSFMAGHIAADLHGYCPQTALEAALNAAAQHVSGDHPK